MDILAQRVKNAREALGLSQSELAEKAGYTSRASINKIEKGLVDVPRSKILSIAKALHVSPVWLLGYEDDKKDLETPKAKFIIALQDANDEQCKEALRYLVYLKSEGK